MFGRIVVFPRPSLDRMQPPTGPVDFGDQKIERVKSIELLSTSLTNARSAAYRRFGVESGPAYKSRNGGGVECELLTTEPSLGWPNVHDPRTLVRAYRSANQLIAVSTWTKIVFDMETHDRSSEHNVGTGEWTAVKAGLYLVIGTVAFTGLADQDILGASIYKAGASMAAVDTKIAKSGSASVGVVSLLLVATGNVVDIRAFHNSAASRNVVGSPDKTFFCVLGPL